MRTGFSRGQGKVQCSGMHTSRQQSTKGEAHIAQGYQAPVKKEHDAQKREDKAQACENDANFCACRETRSSEPPYLCLGVRKVPTSKSIAFTNGEVPALLRSSNMLGNQLVASKAWHSQMCNCCLCSLQAIDGKWAHAASFRRRSLHQRCAYISGTSAAVEMGENCILSRKCRLAE